jgi:hypothetical protein
VELWDFVCSLFVSSTIVYFFFTCPVIFIVSYFSFNYVFNFRLFHCFSFLSISLPLRKFYDQDIKFPKTQL